MPELNLASGFLIFRSFWHLVCNSWTTVYSNNGSTLHSTMQYFRSKMKCAWTLSALFVWNNQEACFGLYTEFQNKLLVENWLWKISLCLGTSSSQLRDLGTAFEACRRKDILVTSLNLFRNFLRFSRSFCSFYTIPVLFASFQHFLHHFGTFAQFLKLSRHFCTFRIIYAPLALSAPFASFLHPFVPFFRNFRVKFCPLFASVPNGLFSV